VAQEYDRQTDRVCRNKCHTSLGCAAIKWTADRDACARALCGRYAHALCQFAVVFIVAIVILRLIVRDEVVYVSVFRVEQAAAASR